VRDTAVSRGFQRLAVSAVVMTLVLIALGGAVRATDSGLACPTWPGCFTAGDFVPPANLNVWLEHTHRLVAGVVGLQVAALASWALARHRSRGDLLWPTLVAAVLVVAQALLGAAVVWLQLRAELVTTHLGMAMIVLACLIGVAVQAVGGVRPAATGPDRRFAWTATGVAALAFAQILVGGHVTGVAAGLAFDGGDFPVVDGTIARAAELTHREVFHIAHRGLAYLLAVAVVVLAARAFANHRRLRRSGTEIPGDRWLVRLPMWAAMLVVVQIAVGFANIVSELSFLSVIPHLTVASWIWTVLVTTALLAWRHGSAAQGERRRRAASSSRPVGVAS
jgi:cytochrome c oxidase assembly protein subunit 15